MLTVKYQGKELILDSDKIEFLQRMSSFCGKNVLELEKEETYEELKIISENLFDLQTTLEENFLCDYYGIKTFYDKDYLKIYRRNSDELFPFLDPSENNNIRMFNEIIDLFTSFSDNMVIAGRYLMEFLFSIDNEYIDFYIYCDDLNDFLRRLRKHISHFMAFEEDEHKITIYKTLFIHKKNFNNRSEIAKQFTVDCEQCILDLKYKIIYRTERCIYSHENSLNTLNFENLSQEYYYKLGKYCCYGFKITFPSLEKTVVFPDDLEEYNEYFKDINHRGIYLLIYNVCKYKLFNENNLLQDKIDFDRNEDFFNFEVIDEEYEHYVPLQEFLSKYNLHYWFKKEKFDFLQIILEKKIFSNCNSFINCILGYKILDEDICFNKNKNIIDLIEHILIKNGFDQNLLKEYRDSNEELEEYFSGLEEYLSVQEDTEYIKQCLLLIYDYQDFECSLNYDQKTLNMIDDLKQEYNERIKREKISSEILSSKKYLGFKREESDIVPYYKQNKNIHVNKNKTINSFYFKIENDEIFINSNILNDSFNYKPSKTPKRKSIWYQVYIKLYQILQTNDETLWKEVELLVEFDDKIQSTTNFRVLKQILNTKTITEETLLKIPICGDYHVDEEKYTNTDVTVYKSVKLVNDIFQRLNIGFDNYFLGKKIKSNFPYLNFSIHSLYDLLDLKDELFIFENNHNHNRNFKKDEEILDHEDFADY